MTRRGRAVRFDEYGGLDALYIAEVDVPDPPPGEVLVAVKAAGINPGEGKIREGFLRDRFPATFPSGQGTDLAGVIDQIGEGVDGLAVGDEVAGWTDRRASQAEYVNVPGDQLVAKPASVEWPVAGSLFVAGVTAYAAVRAVAAGPGDTVAVSAAAGGVGSITVQLLKARGATVIAIASEANHSWLSSIGVTPVAYGDGLAERVRAAAPAGVDAFIDTYGEEYVKLAIDLGVRPERVDTITAFEAAQKYRVKTEGSAAASSADVLVELVDLVASGRITVPIDATYPLDRVREAYAELEKGHTRGKIVLIP
ncbi:MAG TPA: NADP-dependent oxidoreductase [Acidimicrobiales bacterium]|jgi:NADPH:quinone reductase-like Zn-dependent oxidoreductase